jgi:mRNA interferase HigB
MRVFSLKRLREFWRLHPDAELPLRLWYKTAIKSSWSSIAAVRKTYPHADAVQLESGAIATVFNIRGNHYRLICSIDYKFFHVYVKAVLTHRQYDDGTWKEN